MQIFTRIALRIGAIILIPGATSVIIAMLLGGGQGIGGGRAMISGMNL